MQAGEFTTLLQIKQSVDGIANSLEGIEKSLHALYLIELNKLSPNEKNTVGDDF